MDFSDDKYINENLYESYGSFPLLEKIPIEVDYLCEGRYRILKFLRLGGMSNIYLAEDLEKNGLICVVKEMSDYYSTPDKKSEAIYRFEVEAYIMVSLKHSGIPDVNNYFIENDKYYLVMEYIRGVNLGDFLLQREKNGFPEKDVISWGVEICDILEYLHSHKPPIIHRDINPFNFIKRELNDKVVIIDFGIATLADRENEVELIGTPGYIAPEQYKDIIDIRSDIYSLGVTLYELLTGEDPTLGLPFEFMPLRALNPDFSEWIEIVIDKALQIDMDDRFSSAAEFKEALLLSKFDSDD